MIDEKRIDTSVISSNPKRLSNKDLQTINLNSISHKDVQEIGAEWLSYQAIGQLQLGTFLQI